MSCRILSLKLVLLFTVCLYGQNKEAFLSNFRIESSNPTRIYFDVSGDISTLTVQGFKLSQNTIKGINRVNNFFEVTKAFTYWDNSTIRLENGDGTVEDFNLVAIENKIQLSANFNQSWYVDSTRKSSGDGKTQNTAFKSISEAIKAITQGGAIIHVKKGIYRNDELRLWNALPKTSKSEPVVIQGYSEIPGDLNGIRYYKYEKGKSLDGSEAPLMEGGDRSKGTGLSLAASGVTNRDYIIVKNLQFQNFRKGIISNGGSNLGLDNCVIRNSGIGTSDNGIHFYSGQNNRITNCISINASVAAFNIGGSHNFVANCEAYGEDSGALKMDYYYSVKGRNNIFFNNLSKKILNDGKDWEHGFSLSGDIQGETEYNLIQGHEATGGVRGVELRRGGCAYNVVRGLKAYDTELGIQIRDGANNNVVEDGLFVNVNKGIDFSATKEAGDGSAYYNILQNLVIVNANYVLFHRGKSEEYKPEVKGNKFFNLTIFNASLFWKNYEILPKSSSNEWINCNIVNVKSQGYKVGQSFSNSNFFGSWQSLVGSSNISEEPGFVDPKTNNFRLKSTSKLIDAGKDLKSVKTDFEGNHRPQGSSSDIGAFEFIERLQGSNNLDLGEDRYICSGDQVELSAKGAQSYLWNTGETTSNIFVSPNRTTTYEVIGYNDGISTLDSITVFVDQIQASAGNDVSIDVGELVTLTASGGNIFLWSNGERTKSITVSPSTTTEYTVIVSNGSCEDFDQVIVTVDTNQEKPKANAGQDVSICKGESITLTASGGENYLWSTNESTSSIEVNPTENTVYNVIVYNSNGSDTDSVNVFVTDVVADAGDDRTIEPGSSITLVASGGDEYIWSNGSKSREIEVTPLETTEYTVVVKKNGCEDTDQVLITVVAPEIQIFSETGKNTLCSGESTNLYVTGGDNYQWSTGETNSSINVSPDESTVYSVRVEKNGEYYLAQYSISVINCNQNGVNTSFSEDLTVYPNPGKEFINIAVQNDESESFDLNILNMEGKIVHYDKISQNISGFSKQIDVSRLSKGVYYLRVYNANNLMVKKVMVL
ncbi:T9SS type A sorting domain-containing protein [Lutimonas saemankumensis]|uniref:T9SS type A sorting domain-containing protein n=1 Tax=Lutimonas saemankumensis TaxID=483016 RepID=UPI001CD26CE1|nr:T9SS type A sorting domain-containing protein [Lutimonas saemankumensis]MCA0931046.1 T9SS type A sorting domain-containing protein [Lutimonas saemankumensis]